MFNRLSNYWYNREPEPELTAEERAEQIRQRRLRQFEQGPAQNRSAQDEQFVETEVPEVFTSHPTDSAPSPATQPVSTELNTEPDDTPFNQTSVSNPGDGPQVVGSAVVKTIDPATLAMEDDPWCESEWDEPPVESTPTETVDDGKLVSLTISRVFCVAVSTEIQPSSQPQFLTMLLDTAASTNTLSLDILDEVLFERLSMSAPELRECQIEIGGGARCPVEPMVVPYLAGCVSRCDNELRTNSRGVISQTLRECRSAAVRMIGIVLLSNDSWSPQDPAQQLVESLITTSEHSVYDTETSYHFTNQILAEIMSQESVSAEDLTTMIRPVLACMTRKTTMCSLISTPLTVSILNALNTLVANKNIAKVIPDLPGWLPTNPDSGAAYHDTFLGKLLGCSTIRRDMIMSDLNRYVSPYFNRSTVINQDISQHSSSQYQQMLDTIQTLTSKFIYHLIKSEAKDRTLSWIVSCLDANRNKAKLVASFVSSSGASDGFMLNLAAVLLKLSIPFLGPLNAKLSTVDVRFCGPHSRSLFPQYSEDKILDKIDGIEVSKEDLLTLGTPDTFNFISTCFYLTHRALQIAYVAPFDKYRRLMKSLMETQRLVQDMGASPFSVDTGIRDRFETQFVEQLEVKTHLLHPDTIAHVLLFYCSSTNWLSHISIDHDSVTVTDMKSSLIVPDAPSKTIAMVPNYFISAACQFLINIRYFAEASLENFVSENLEHLISFLVLFCHPTWVPNPHTRAELVEAMTVFIPNERSQSSVATTNREAALCSNLLAQEKLGSALIRLFVDIEHTAQFEHKFQYRFHIFELLQYIWPRQSFKVSKMSFEVRGREEDTTVLFTRFVKLLMNDANFLLDEALHNLEEIKKLQMEQDDTDTWNALEENVRQSKLKTLADLKRMCTSHNILSYETVNCLRYMTGRCEGMGDEDHRNVTYAFVTPLLVDTLVTMLNYYLKELVGDSQTKYKVRNLDEVKFYPGKLLQSIVHIYINLKDESSFVHAIPRDGRSYHPSLFKETAVKLCKLYVPEDVITDLLKVSVLAEGAVTSHEDEELLTDRAPNHYLDPILGTLMTEPVLLPSSNMIVDRSVIAKHLLSDPIDPFNRQPLQMSDVVPQTDLRDEINSWKGIQLVEILKERVDGTEGNPV